MISYLMVCVTAFQLMRTNYAVIAVISGIMEKKFIRKPLIIRSPETVGSVKVVRWYVGFVITTVDIRAFLYGQKYCCTGATAIIYHPSYALVILLSLIHI